jgi:hypothetical protein
VKTAIFVAAASLVISSFSAPVEASELTKGFKTGTPDIKAISLLETGPDGLLFIADSKSGNIFAIDTGDISEPTADTENFAIADLEGKIGAMLGTSAEDIMIHDMAVNQISGNTYLSVSRARSSWTSRWVFPNELADAKILLRVTVEKKIEEFKLENVSFAKMSIPNPVDLNQAHRWKEGITTRADAFTGLVYEDGKLYVSGLSNEEFASAMWTMDFPFNDEPSWTTLEVFHGAHGKFETHAPIRAFLPYELNGKSHILASYLCTPLVTFPTSDLASGKGIKGRTIAELGSGNYPIDMVSVKHEDKEFIVISHSMLPLMTINKAEIEDHNKMPGIERESPTYLEGAEYTPRSGNGVQQMDNFGEGGIMALQRLPSGKLDMVALSVGRLAY